jgi:CRISPR type IV-associated protein Csf1
MSSTNLTGGKEVTTASRLWALTYGIAVPADVPKWTDGDTRCVMCGTAVRNGEQASRADKRLDNGFNSKLECKYSGQAICGDCEAVWDTRWMGKLQDSKAVAILGHGIFTLRKKDDLAAFILHEIPAPYVAIWNSRQQAHMVWRTPVSIPNDIVREIRLDDEVMTIDRSRVIAAVGHWIEAHNILEALGRPRLSLFEIVWGLDSTTAGLPSRPFLVEAVRKQSPAGAEHIAFLETLTAADWWGLLALREVNLQDPTTWPKLRSVDDRMPVAA